MPGTVVILSKDAGLVKRSQELFSSEQTQFEQLNPADFNPTELLKKEPVLLLADIPGEDALEAVKIIQLIRTRETLRKIPIIALVGSLPREMLLAIHQSGVKDILLKSGKNELLRERILSYIQPAQGSLETGNVPPAPIRRTASKGQWSDPAATAFKKQVQREVSKRLEMLPSLPVVVMEIMQLVDSAKSCAADFEEHINHDQVLAARILKISNSSFFGQSRTIKSIKDAIVVLGFRTLKSLALAASTSKILDRPAEGYGYQTGGLWKHSIACGVGCRLLAQRMGKNAREAEEFFVYGLLHDIGKLLLNNFVAEKNDEFRDAIEQRKMTSMEAEQELLGTDHCQVGVIIAEKWNLPEDLRKVIKYHHFPARSQQWMHVATPIHAVDFLCHELQIGKIKGTFVKPKLDKKALKQLDLQESLIDDLKEEFKSQLNEMDKLFAMISG